MVYYMYELRWASSDNTLKELDASGSFFMGEDSMIVRQDYEIILKKITIV